MQNAEQHAEQPLSLDTSDLSGFCLVEPSEVGNEQVYHFEDISSYRLFCERAKGAGYDFPNCLSGVDVLYGLRSVLHLRSSSTMAEITVWIDVPYDEPLVPSVSDLWAGVVWHEREAYDLLGIRYSGHPDLRRILLEDDWSIHPLQRRYDTGGYLIPDWRAQDWPVMAASEDSP